MARPAWVEKGGRILPGLVAERLRDAIAGSRLVEIAGADHDTVVLADAFTREVAAFLREARAGAA